MAIFRRRLRSLRPQEGGFTLTELIVSIALLSILMALVTSAIVTMYGGLRKQQNLANVLDRSRPAVEELDKSLRYANAINTPTAGSTSGTLYVEWRLGDTTGGTTTQTCVQWRFVTSTGLLQSRTWTEGATTATAWGNEAINVSAVSGTAVFALATTTGFADGVTPNKQELVVNFQDASGTQQATSRATNVTFAAQNTTSSSVQPNICQGTSLSGGFRP